MVHVHDIYIYIFFRWMGQMVTLVWAEWRGQCVSSGKQTFPPHVYQWWTTEHLCVHYDFTRDEERPKCSLKCMVIKRKDSAANTHYRRSHHVHWTLDSVCVCVCVCVRSWVCNFMYHKAHTEAVDHVTLISATTARQQALPGTSTRTSTGTSTGTSTRDLYPGPLPGR